MTTPPGYPPPPGDPYGPQPGQPPPPGGPYQQQYPPANDPFQSAYPPQPDNPYGQPPPGPPPSSGGPYGPPSSGGPYGPPSSGGPYGPPPGTPTSGFPIAGAPTSGFPAGPGYAPNYPPTSGFPGEQPGGYPGAPGGYPGAPTPVRSRRTPLIIALVVVVLVLVLVGGGLTVFLLSRDSGGDGQPSPTAAVVNFLSAVYKDKDATKASKYVCADARDDEQISRKVNDVRKYEEKFNREPKFTWDEPKVETTKKESVVLSVTVKFSTSDDRASEEKLKITTVKGDGWFVCDVQTL